MSERHDSSHISHECYHAYIAAETKIPNTLTAVGPYVGHAGLKSIQAATDIRAAVKHFANTYIFSRGQMDSAIKAVVSTHGRFGVLVLPQGADVEAKEEIRIFEQARFAVVYMEGIFNILEAILYLHGMRSNKDASRDSQVADLLEQPDKLATTTAIFAAAERAINAADSTEKSEAFKGKFFFSKTGEKSRPMIPAEKAEIQAEVMPFIIAAVKPVLVERKLILSQEQLEKFVFILTFPELYKESV